MLQTAWMKECRNGDQLVEHMAVREVYDFTMQLIVTKQPQRCLSWLCQAQVLELTHSATHAHSLGCTIPGTRTGCFGYLHCKALRGPNIPRAS